MDRLLHLHGVLAYAVLFLVPAMESSIFVGFVFPGEIAVFFGGVLAFRGSISLGGALAAGIAGALIGDSIGYEVGKHVGRRLLSGRLGRIVGEERRQRATDYLRRNGGKAVFFGRFTAAFRVLVPGFAGMADMPYRTFLLFNALGGILWAGGMTMLGYSAGAGYHRVEHVFRRASVVLLGLVLSVAIIAATARWIARHPDRIRAWWERQMRRPLLARFRRQLGFVGRRFRPSEAYGLWLTAGLVVLAGVGSAFGLLIRDVAQRADLVHVDEPFLHVLMRHTEGGVTSAMKVITAFGDWPFTVAVIGAAGIFLLFRRAWPDAALIAIAPLGAWAIGTIVKNLVRRARPAVHALVHATGFAFPSGHAVRAAALFGALALIAARRAPWPLKVALWTTAFVVAALVGFSRLYLRVHFLTDVLGGLALGAAWLSAVGTATGVWWRVTIQTRRGDHPAGRKIEAG